MAVLFEGQPGRVLAFEDPSVPGQARFISTTPTLDFESHRSVITRCTVSQQGNFQFLHTLGSDVYIYVFGDRIGQLTLTGLSFGQCGDQGPHGAEQLLKFYQDNRLARREAEMEVLIGQTSIRAFLIGITADIADAQFRLFHFQLQLAMLPERLPRIPVVAQRPRL